MNKFPCHIVILGVIAALAMTWTYAQEPSARLLFLSKSVGFEHSVIAQKDGKPSWADNILTKLAEEHDATITCTKDASLINAENLKNYDIVVFYTQGDLTQVGDKDGAPPMSENGLEELLTWIKNGGRFMGFHCASDTFHTPSGAPVTAYIKMLGGEFAGHGAQFRGTVKVVDSGHPTMTSIPQNWTIREEWYTFKNLNTDSIHVLALLDPGEERAKQKMYDVPPYPIIWCREYGAGLVYFNGMGHREDVWTNPTFQQSIVDAATWLMAEPNYDKVVPKEGEK